MATTRGSENENRKCYHNDDDENILLPTKNYMLVCVGIESERIVWKWRK